MTLRNYQDIISTKAAEILKLNHLCYLSMECRTGKTLTALSTAEKYGTDYVLFITKLKAIPSIYADYNSLKPSFKIEVINYESAHKVTGYFDFVIIDEAHSLGAYPKPSKRAQDLKNICFGMPILYLSGTPSPESYSQLYHQFWVSSFSPWKKFQNFYKWVHAGYVFVRPRRINGYIVNDYTSANTAKIYEDTKDLFISYSQEQAGFEVNIDEILLDVSMKQETSQYLKTLRKDKVLNMDGKTILADTPAKLLSKMHQLSSGTVISEEGEHIVTDESKALFVKNQFSGKKIAIFYVYQSEADLLHKVFSNWTDSPEEFQGSLDEVFISQVRRAREGVRLDTADALIFFNLEFSYLSYEQGRNRLVSKERKVPAKVYFLCSDCGIEKDILNAVHGKQDFTLSYYGKAIRK